MVWGYYAEGLLFSELNHALWEFTHVKQDQWTAEVIFRPLFGLYRPAGLCPKSWCACISINSWTKFYCSIYFCFKFAHLYWGKNLSMITVCSWNCRVLSRFFRWYIITVGPRTTLISGKQKISVFRKQCNVSYYIGT